MAASIDLKGLMLGDAIDRAKASFDTFEKAPKIKRKTKKTTQSKAQKAIIGKTAKKSRKRAA